MGKTTLLSVIKGNIECAFCKKKNCPLRYYPNHTRIVGGTRLGCDKDFEKKLKGSFSRKLP